MTTLVTGAAGFIGTHLVDELLRRDQRVRGLVHRPDQAAALAERGAEVIVGDIRDPNVAIAAVREARVVHHCAAAVGDYSEQEIEAINLGGVKNILAAIEKQRSGRVVLISGINVLGNRHYQSVTEDFPFQRSNEPRGDLKIKAEQLALNYHRDRGVDVVILRPGTIYGPGDRNTAPLLKAIRRGKFVFIGSRNNLIPLVHVDDFVQAMVLASEYPNACGRIYHITNGERVTIGQLVDRLAQLVDCPVPRRVLPYAIPWSVCTLLEFLRKLHLYSGRSPVNRVTLRFLGKSRHVEIARAIEELGYEPQYRFPEVIESSAHWFIEEEQNREAGDL